MVLGSSADSVPRTCDFTSCCQDCCVDLTPRPRHYLESSFVQDILLINCCITGSKDGIQVDSRTQGPFLNLLVSL